jgi:hypothetical protein
MTFSGYDNGDPGKLSGKKERLIANHQGISFDTDTIRCL